MDKIDLRYQRGKIYTIRCYDDDKLIYVGSTIEKLSTRMAKHRYTKDCSLSQYVIDNFNGNWKNWYIELYEEYPCDNKELLEKKEKVECQCGSIVCKGDIKRHVKSLKHKNFILTLNKE